MIVLDTDVLVEVLRKRPAVVARISELREDGHELATTSINEAEVLRGRQASADLAIAVKILDGLVTVPFGPRAARRYGRLMHGLDRAGRPIPVADGLIAAATLEAGAALLTGNVRHFDRVPGLDVIVAE